MSGRAPKFKKMMDVKSPKRFSNFYLVSLINGLDSKQFREKPLQIQISLYNALYLRKLNSNVKNIFGLDNGLQIFFTIIKRISQYALNQVSRYQANLGL